jgi:hypothetical protein
VPTITEFIEHTKNSNVSIYDPNFLVDGLEIPISILLHYIILRGLVWRLYNCRSIFHKYFITLPDRPAIKYQLFNTISATYICRVLLEKYTEVKILENMRDPLYMKVETH